MDMNMNRFDAKGNVYAKSRPDYPKALFAYLSDSGLTDKSISAADIGSGTGIFTVQLARFVGSVFAVEPNRDMRSKAEECFESYDNVISVDAAAENTGLPDHSVELITVAQAFHWFDRDAFKSECKRILKPNGRVILVWNDRDASSDIIKANFEVNKLFCPNFKGSSNGIDFSKNAFSDFFEGNFELLEFDNALVYDRTAFIARNLSSSYAPKTEQERYCEYIKAIESVFDRFSKNGTVKYPYITRCYIGPVDKQI